MNTYYFIYTEDAYGMPVPLSDSATGAPSVFLLRQNAQAECDQLNMDTDGGYFVGEAQYEDAGKGASQC